MAVSSAVLMVAVPFLCPGYHPWQLCSGPAAPLPHLFHHPSSHLWCRQAAQPEQEEGGNQRGESRALAIRYRIPLVVQCQVSSGPLQENGGCRGGGKTSVPGLGFMEYSMVAVSNPGSRQVPVAPEIGLLVAPVPPTGSHVLLHMILCCFCNTLHCVSLTTRETEAESSGHPTHTPASPVCSQAVPSTISRV